MSKIKVDSIVPRGGVPSGATGGGIIQIVEKNDASQSSTTSTSWTNSGVSSLNLSITPSSTSSKILMMVSLQLEMNGAQTGSIIFARNPAGSPVYFANTEVASGLNPGNDSDGVSKLFLSQGYGSLNGQTTSHYGIDSPATTSSVTYGFLWGVNNGTAYYNRGIDSSYTGSSSIILMEVSG